MIVIASSESGLRGKEKLNAYLLPTEFGVRTVSYGPSIFPPRFMAQVRSARVINRRGKNEDP